MVVADEALYQAKPGDEIAALRGPLCLLQDGGGIARRNVIRARLCDLLAPWANSPRKADYKPGKFPKLDAALRRNQFPKRPYRHFDFPRMRCVHSALSASPASDKPSLHGELIACKMIKAQLEVLKKEAANCQRRTPQRRSCSPG